MAARRKRQPTGYYPARRYFVWSTTILGKGYVVYVYRGRAVCDCLGYQTHGTDCRHIKEVLMSQAESEILTREEMTTALAPVLPEMRVVSPLPSPNEMQAIFLIIQNIGGAAGLTIPKAITSPAVALTVILRGHELGVGPMTAMRHIVPINGIMEPDAQLMQGIAIARAGERRGTR